MEKDKKSENSESSTRKDNSVRSTPKQNKECNDDTCTRREKISEEDNFCADLCCNRGSKSEIPYLPPFCDLPVKNRRNDELIQKKKDDKKADKYDKNENINLLRESAIKQQPDKTFDKDKNNSKSYANRVPYVSDDTNDKYNKTGNDKNDKNSIKELFKAKNQPDKTFDKDKNNSNTDTNSVVPNESYDTNDKNNKDENDKNFRQSLNESAKKQQPDKIFDKDNDNPADPNNVVPNESLDTNGKNKDGNDKNSRQSLKESAKKQQPDKIFDKDNDNPADPNNVVSNESLDTNGKNKDGNDKDCTHSFKDSAKKPKSDKISDKDKNNSNTDPNSVVPNESHDTNGKNKNGNDKNSRQSLKESAKKQQPDNSSEKVNYDANNIAQNGYPRTITVVVPLEKETQTPKKYGKNHKNSFLNSDHSTADVSYSQISEYNSDYTNTNLVVVPLGKEKQLQHDTNISCSDFNCNSNCNSNFNRNFNSNFNSNSEVTPLKEPSQQQNDINFKNLKILNRNNSVLHHDNAIESGKTNSVTTVGALKEIPKEEIKDPYCNADNPQILSFHDITSAAFMIKDGIERTPCIRSRMSEDLGMELFMKMEIMQYTGSFKERGARYALLKLPAEQKKQGVIAASLGNHAQGLSYHAHLLGIPATVVMPTAAPIMKIQNCRNYGANVLVQGKDMGEAKKIAMQLSKDKNLLYINGYDHPHIMAGQGTIGLEILEQVPNPDAVIIPIGGAGLMAGIATAIKALNPSCMIIGVESDKCASYSNAVENNSPIYTVCKNTLADGLAVPTVGYNAFATSTSLIDKVVVVKEEWIALGILRLVEAEKCVVEGAGAACLAAILAGHLNELKGKRVVILISGGNIDTTIFGRCLERGLAADGRLIKFTVRVTDAPGGLKGLCDLLASNGVSVKDIMHERAWLKDVFSVEIKCICETRDWNHSIQVKNILKNTYEYVEFVNEPLAVSNI